MEWLQALAYIVAVAFLVMSMIFRKQLVKAKKVMKELAEAMSETYKAIEDGKLTPEEVKKLIKEWKDVIDAFIQKREASQEAS